MIKNLLIFLCLFIITPDGFSQIESEFEVSNSTLLSSSESMPLWLWANRDGKIAKENSFLNLSELEGSGKFFFNDSNSFLSAGTTLVAGLGNNTSYFQANQIFAGVNLNNWELNAGWFYNEKLFGGLSTTNGNIAQSRNSRPHPRIAFRVADYKPVPWIGKYLLFKGVYEEGWLNDNRYVDKTHLHHKSFYLKLKPFKNFDIQGGIEHFVMWGGTSTNENIGALPDDWCAYWQYVTGRSGDENFLPGDQHNIAGNQYGTYQFLFTQRLKKIDVSLNFSHPFDDLSGMNLRNWPDNVIGLYLKFKNQNKFISQILYEFTNTRHQGIDSLYRWNEDEQEWQQQDFDNYYNNGVYRSGATYQKLALSSPLLFPVIIDENISKGFESNRFVAHHVGMKGKVYTDISWKGMMTFIHHLGTWNKPYNQKRQQVSGYLELFYSGKKLPFQAGIIFAGDINNAEKDKAGIQFTLSKSW